MAPKKPAAPLKAPDVYVRIRPLATAGGHAEDGTVLAKVLQEWDEKSVTVETQYMFSKSEAKYTYPKCVFGTEASQQEVCDSSVPGLVQSFTSDRTSVLFFAYGQTGTGKTRTMFGTEPSLASSEPHEDWGVFPRVCAQTFERMAAMAACGVRCVLTASAIEFYMGEGYDLLSSSAEGNARVQINFETHMPAGETVVVLQSTADLMPFLAKVIANRTARSTNFNVASQVHSGSSRSHAALILTLHQLDTASRDYVQTTFTLVDLAGAERPDKVKAEVKGGGTSGITPEFLSSLIDARDKGSTTQAEIDKMLPIGFQTRVINHELFSLGHEVVKATEANKKGAKWGSPMASPTIKFLSAILDGRARLAMMVTLSPAGQNAWETWFSLQYGADLSKLRVPLKRQKGQDIDKLHKAAVKEAATLAAEAQGVPPTNKYHFLKNAKAVAATQLVERLEMVLKAAA